MSKKQKMKKDVRMYWLIYIISIKLDYVFLVCFLLLQSIFRIRLVNDNIEDHIFKKPIYISTFKMVKTFK